MANQAQYAATPKVGVGTVTTGDASRTAPTNVSTVFTAGANGSRIDRINLVGIGATVSSMLRLFLYSGATYTLWQEVAVSAVTPSSSVPVFATDLSLVIQPSRLPIVLPSGWSLRASVNDTQTGSGVNVIAVGGDF